MFEYLSGFTTAQQENVEKKLTVIGKIPDWLFGTYIRNGPAKFSVGEEKLNHWFDGYAMLHRFYINAGEITYTNRFIQSEAYTQANAQQKVCFAEFATNPQKNWLHKLFGMFDPALTDNTNVNVVMLNGQHVALTETCRYIHYDVNTLETLGHFQFADNLPGQITTAHPQYDYDRDELYNFTIEIGPTCYYHFYKLAKNSQSRQLVATLPVSQPAYLHSFAMTKNYLILIEPPLRMSALKFIVLQKPFIENYHWDQTQGTRITVIDKNNGAVIFQQTMPACYFFHQINAFEHHQEIFIDLPLFADDTIIQQLYLNSLEKNGLATAKPTRIHLHLGNKKITQSTIAECSIELPRLNYRSYQSKNYHYAYGVSQHQAHDFINQLVKIDVQAQTYQTWRAPHHYPGEPVFVADPKNRAEDQGVILSVVLDASLNTSFLLILDAASFEEIARCDLPQVMPFGFHGHFYRG